MFLKSNMSIEFADVMKANIIELKVVGVIESTGYDYSTFGAEN